MKTFEIDNSTWATLRGWGSRKETEDFLLKTFPVLFKNLLIKIASEGDLENITELTKLFIGRCRAQELAVRKERILSIMQDLAVMGSPLPNSTDEVD